MGLKEKTEKLSKKIRVRLTLLLILLVVVIIFVDRNVFNNQIQNVAISFDLIMLVIFSVLMIVFVGFNVMKSLFHVATGLSLIIFLAQSYCSVPNHTIYSDNALKGLLWIAFVYIFLDFFEMLYKGFNEYVEMMERIKWCWEKLVLLLLFIAFSCLFIWDIYQVMNPIILDLCIYK